MLSKKSLVEFKEIYEQETGEKISDEFAFEQATSLLTLFNVIYSPIKKEWLNPKHDGAHQEYA